MLISELNRSEKDNAIEKFETILGENNTEIISFASPVKQIIANTFDIQLQDLEDYKNNPEEYGLEIKVYPNNQPSGVIKYLDFKTILQNLGTEAMKPVFGENVWDELAIRKAIKSNKEWVLIPYSRFILEALEGMYKTDKEFKIFTINIFNSDLPKPDEYTSENELKDKEFKFDFTVDSTERSCILNQINLILEDISLK